MIVLTALKKLPNLRHWVLYEIIGRCQSKMSTRTKLLLSLTLLPKAALVYSFAYAKHMLRFNVRCTLSYLKSNARRVLFIKMKGSSFLRIIASTSSTSTKCWHYTSRLEWLLNCLTIISFKRKLNVWPHIRAWSLSRYIYEHSYNQDCCLFDRKYTNEIIFGCTECVQKIHQWFRRMARALNDYLQKDKELD